MPIMTPSISDPWVKIGTKLRCVNELEIPNPFCGGRPFKVKVDREATIVAIGPGGEAEDEDGRSMWIEDIPVGNIVIGWFDFGTGKRNGHINQMRGDFVYYWEPRGKVNPARSRDQRPMIVARNPSMPGKETTQQHIGYWASSPDPDADYYMQQGIELPWPGDFIDESWDADERAMVIKYLKETPDVEHWMGLANCRLGCEEDLGASDKGDVHFVWPDGFAHYVEAHGVKPAAEFIRHVWRANGVYKGCFGDTT